MVPGSAIRWLEVRCETLRRVPAVPTEVGLDQAPGAWCAETLLPGVEEHRRSGGGPRGLETGAQEADVRFTLSLVVLRDPVGGLAQTGLETGGGAADTVGAQTRPGEAACPRVGRRPAGGWCWCPWSGLQDGRLDGRILDWAPAGRTILGRGCLCSRPGLGVGVSTAAEELCYA